MSKVADCKQEFPLNPSGLNYRLLTRTGSKKLIIFFSGTGKKNGKFDFWAVGNNLGENVIFLSDSRNFWYQEGVAGIANSISGTVARILEFCESAGVYEIVTVGASMGGYAAVLYGALLTSDIKVKVLAFSFDSILKLPTSPSEKHMNDLAPVHYPDLLKTVQTYQPRIHIYVGEFYTMDLLGAERLSTIPNVTIQSLRGVDHSTARFVHQSMGLETMIDQYSAIGSLPGTYLKGDIIGKKGTIELLHKAHLCFSRNELSDCIDHCNLALREAPFCDPLHFMIGKAYLAQKLPVLACQHFGSLTASLPEHEEVHFYFANALRSAKQLNLARYLLTGYLEKWPKSARLWLNLALTQEALGEFVSALDSMRKAQKLQTNYDERLLKMQKRITARLAE